MNCPICNYELDDDYDYCDHWIDGKYKVLYDYRTKERRSTRVKILYKIVLEVNCIIGIDRIDKLLLLK